MLEIYIILWLVPMFLFQVFLFVKSDHFFAESTHFTFKKHTFQVSDITLSKGHLNGHMIHEFGKSYEMPMVF
jgi:hypothetical protein